MTNQRKRPLINPYEAPQSDAASADAESAHVRPASLSTHRKADPAPSAGASDERDDALVLPEDAFIAIRKSGGLMFRSRELVVYRDGRIVRRGQGGGHPRFEETAQSLSSEQLDDVVKMVRRVRLSRTFGAAHQSPDTFVYDIAVRNGRDVKTLEVGQHKVTPTLQTLLSWFEQRSEPSDT